MTKDEAIQAMKDGKKVAHRYFSPDEYITMNLDEIITEEGYHIAQRDFWLYKKEAQWLYDWYLWVDAKAPNKNI